MNTGNINTGDIGRALARPWLRVGHHLLLAQGGSQAKLGDFLRGLDPAASARTMRGSLRQAAGFGGVVLFSAY